METKKSEKTNEKVTPLLVKKGYEKMANGIVPIQQSENYRKPTGKVVGEAVKELNPDWDSMESRG